MALSKPKDLILQLTSAYFQRLYTSPLKTKAITRYVIANTNCVPLLKYILKGMLFVLLVVSSQLLEILSRKKYLVQSVSMKTVSSHLLSLGKVQ